MLSITKLTVSLCMFEWCPNALQASSVASTELHYSCKSGGAIALPHSAALALW